MANVDKDEPKYKVSPTRALELMLSGKYNRIIMLDGWEGLQEVIPEDAPIERIHGGFGSAWAIVPSDGVPVWQMQSQRFGRERT